MDAVSEIKARLSIEDIVSDYVQLKRAGRNFKGLSPFTNEKSPSFVVSPEKQIWHDFSSGRGGDVFSFIQEVEGLDFKGSLELLARKAGVDLEEFRPKNQGEQVRGHQSKERLFSAVEHAVKFYQIQLTKHTDALKYLREKRGYEKQTLLDFRFGFSPASGKALTTYLLSKKFTESELQQAGLVSSRGRDVFDMFRGRIMIPLLDPQGRPVGFTARQITDDKNSPKYINTPATVLYDKGRQVFGLSQAKEAIRRSGYAVVVEGNLDVVASHQAGIKQVVASAGTALTTYHLKSIQRFTGDIRLAFDDDRAGQDAAERAIPLAQGLGIELSIVRLPTGKDPDELIKQNPKLWEDTVQKSQYMIDWLIDHIAESVDIKSAQGKRQFTNRIMSIVKQLQDTVEQEHYVRKIAEITKTSFETVVAKLRDTAVAERRMKHIINKPKDEPKVLLEQRVREQHLLAMCLRSSLVSTMLNKLPLDVFSEDAQETARYLQEHPGVSPSGQEYAKMLLLLFEEYYQHTDEEELMYQAKQLLSRLVSTYAKLKKQAIAQELTGADEQKQTTLLRAVKQLDDLIVQFSKQ